MISELLGDELVPAGELHVAESQQDPVQGDRVGTDLFITAVFISHLSSNVSQVDFFCLPVHGSEVVKVAGIVHLLVQLHVEGDLTKLLVAPVNGA
jgi:hypothetical protein